MHHYCTQGSKHNTPFPVPVPTTLAERVAQTPKAAAWALEKLSLGEADGTQQGGNVAAAIMRGDARVTSNDSFKDSHGTAAFTLQGNNPKKAIEGRHQTHRLKQDQCAYRRELGRFVAS